MNRTSKSIAVFIILIMAISSLSLIMVKPANAQTIPKPSVPEFTLKYVDYSYYEQPTYATDPYTGDQVRVNKGGFTKNDTVEITIKNQPFTSHVDANGNPTTLYYGVRLKGSYENEWRETPKPTYNGYHEATSFDYTTITISLTANGLQAVSPGGQIDFQVQALIGNDNRIPVMMPGGESYYYQFIGETSGWSNTQTVTIGENSTIISPNQTSTPTLNSPTPTPSVPEFPVLAILPFFISVFLVAIYFKHRRTNHA